jgi:hypothetical protein
MRRRAVYLLVPLTAFACACSSDDRAAPQSSASSAPASTTTSVTTTTVPPTTTTSLPSQPADSALTAARALIAAWRAGDRDAAAAVALPAAVDALFVAEAGSVQDRGCNEPPPDTPVLCVYRTAAGELQLRMSPVPGGWIVDQALLTDSG